MNLFLFILIAVSCAFAAGIKPYEGVILHIKKTITNDKSVRVIYATGLFRDQQRTFVLQCNADNSTCIAPAVGADYLMTRGLRDSYTYVCDDYILRSGETFIPVCLDDAY